jgi:hypothetical protein
MVRIERDSAVLSYWALSLLANDWKPIEQRMKITWTNCPFLAAVPGLSVAPASMAATAGGATQRGY